MTPNVLVPFCFCLNAGAPFFVLVESLKLPYIIYKSSGGESRLRALRFERNLAPRRTYFFRVQRLLRAVIGVGVILRIEEIMGQSDSPLMENDISLIPLSRLFFLIHPVLSQPLAP